MTTELRNKLRRRRSLEEHSAIARKEPKKAGWVMDLTADYGQFDPREDIISFGRYAYSQAFVDVILH
jgi:hypothetical protein